jgi:poly-gamma-glutamate capsule biosynthesis protein CapA/YwtB (metallophosphatase superfamily)
MGENDIKILITGDFCPHNRIEKLALKEDFGAIFNDFIDVFKGNDLNITDLECPLTESESARPKTGPHQKALPECIKILKHADIRLAAMANNHIMDYNSKGVIDTIGLCNSNGIATVGVGSTLEDARKPFSISINKKRIAILNFADNEFLTATDSSYSCNPINLVQVYYDIIDAKLKNDYLIDRSGSRCGHLTSYTCFFRL